jgi:hypothetical protein
MLDSETTTHRRAPGRHRRPVSRNRSAVVLTVLRAMGAWFARVKRDR